jgi:mRNA-degrading endonuclease toxin of MazEF toxin-antitoxin module
MDSGRVFVRGDVVYVKPVSVNSNYIYTNYEQKGSRPFVIVSNDLYTQRCANVTGVFTTSQVRRDYPTHVKVDAIGKLKDSVVLCESVATIDKTSITTFMAHLPPEIMNKIDQAIAFHVTDFEIKEAIRIYCELAEARKIKDTYGATVEVASLYHRLKNDFFAYCSKYKKAPDEVQDLIIKQYNVEAAFI